MTAQRSKKLAMISLRSSSTLRSRHLYCRCLVKTWRQDRCCGQHQKIGILKHCIHRSNACLPMFACDELSSRDIAPAQCARERTDRKVIVARYRCPVGAGETSPSTRIRRYALPRQMLQHRQVYVTDADPACFQPVKRLLECARYGADRDHQRIAANKADPGCLRSLASSGR